MKIAVVTGTSTGIGFETSLHLARNGYSVFAGMRNTAKAQPLIDAAKAESLPVQVLQMDVTDADSLQIAFATIHAQGDVSLLVNNAGIGGATPLELTPEVEHRQIFETNYFGTINCIQAVLPSMRKNGTGDIVNISSIAGTGAFPNCPGYCASKGGVVNMTRALAAELGKEKINVNSIAPGNVATPPNAHLRGPGNEEYIELMKTFTPTGIDFIDPDDMTGTAVFLATEDSRMIHGETIIVDAGWSVW